MSRVIAKFDGQYRFLSNFWPCEVTLDGEVYPSVEHAYQAAKFALDAVCPEMSDGTRIRALICMQSHVVTAKRLARRMGPIRPTWEQDKVGVMRMLLRQKFHEGGELYNLLLQTTGYVLEEGNWWGDRFWGVCPAGSGQGTNMLGQLLMEIREG